MLRRNVGVGTSTRNPERGSKRANHGQRENPPHKKRTGNAHLPAPSIQRPNPKFNCTRAHSQKRRKQQMAIAWSSDVHKNEDGVELQYFASVGGDVNGDNTGSNGIITIYEVEINEPRGKLTVKQQYMDQDRMESFYAATFAGRSSYLPQGNSGLEIEDTETSSDLFSVLGCKSQVNYLADERWGSFSGNKGPKLLCVGGASHVIKLIDLVTMRAVHILRGHGNDIYDLKASPANENLLLSSSLDTTIRLWNLESFACVARFAGIHGHKKMVISIAWHISGNSFASAGADQSIRLWDMRDGRIKEAIQASQSLGSDKRSAFKAIEHPFPYFATTNIHSNVVDCVHFMTDCTILSKSTYNTIVQWKPDSRKREISYKTSPSVKYKPPDAAIVLRTFFLAHCERIWFLRFAVDPTESLLTCGNSKGEIFVWNLDDGRRLDRENPDHKIKSPVNMNIATVNSLAFNSKGTVLTACTAAGDVYKCDRGPTTKKASKKRWR